jgi:serine/threonine protein kinase
MECSQRTTSIPNCFKNGVQNQQNKYLDRKNLNDKENREIILNSNENKIINQMTELKDANFKDVEFVRNLCYRNQKFQEDLEIHSYLNSGSCGVVYSGEIKKSLNKKVALKLLVSNKVTKIKRDKIIRREVQIMQKLKNKQSVNLYGIYEVGDKETICMVMEYAKYGDLENFQKLIQKKTFNETLLAYICKQVLGGLFQCKLNGIIHLDIKQQNLLMDENLNVKLSDFSVSLELNKNLHPKTLSLPLVGTSLFMSPEVLSKKTIKTEDVNKTDIFSLGVLLFNLGFNLYPYDLKITDKKNFEEIHRKISTNELKIPELTKHSVIFREFLKGILDRNIETRFSIEEALNHPWIKASNFIFEEKEKILDLEKFLINMVTDNIKSFNDAVKFYNF